MKQIVIISGKGGTGKTTVVLGLLPLFNNSVIVDCDVDAPDVHIVLEPDIKNENLFPGGKNAIIDNEICTNCGLCEKKCHFNAISNIDGKFEVNKFLCEGCGLCYHLCPAGAIKMEKTIAGKWYESESRFGPFYHANLIPGEENSGKLITMLRHQARLRAEEEKRDFILIDGPPGTGCPVISSITGTDYALIVTEPTVSGVSDLKRAHSLATHFKIKSACIVNKSTLNPKKTQEIRKFCEANNIVLLSEIPYDIRYLEAIEKRMTPYEYGDEDIKETFKAIKEGILRGINDQ